MSEVTIVAKVDVKPEHRDEIFSVLKKLVGPSRAEEGNRQYDLHEVAEKPCSFVFVERWASEDAIALHGNTPHFQGFLKAIDGKVGGVEITTMRKVEF